MIWRLYVQATARQSPTETYVNRFAKWYTPIVVFACLCLALAPLAARVNDPKVILNGSQQYAAMLSSMCCMWWRFLPE